MMYLLIIILTLLGVFLYLSVRKNKEIKEQLSSTLYRLNTSQKFAEVGSWQLNISTGEAIWSDELKTLLGYEQNVTMHVEKFNDAVHPDDLHKVSDAIIGAFERDEKFDVEYRVIWPDGSLHWLLDRAALVRDKNGRPQSMLGIVQDITTLKLAELNQSKQRAQLQLALDAAKAGTFNCDYQSMNLIWDNHSYDLFSINPSETLITIEKWLNKIYSSDKSDISNNYKNAILNKKDIDLIYRIENKGKTFWIKTLIHFSTNKNGETTSFSGLHLDITKEKNYEQAILKSENQFRSLVNSISDVVLTLSIKGEVLSSNSSLETMFGYKLSDIIGEDIKVLLEDKNIKESGTNNIFNLLIKNGEGIFEFNAKNKDGEKFPIELTTSKMTIADKKLYTCIVRNITERKKVENLKSAKDAAEKANHEKSEFLMNISHELRTPLHGILAYTELGVKNIENSSPDLNKIKKYLESINTSGERLSNLISNILDYSGLQKNIETPRFSKSNIIPLIENCIKESQQLLIIKELNVITKFEIQEMEAEIVPTKIEQLTNNLLSNAIKYSMEKSSIEISINFEKDQSTQEEYIQFSIKDTGLLIPEDELLKIFNPFSESSETKTGAGGSALGLAMCRAIIKLHNGKIWAESSKESGTIFTFIIPCVQP